MISPTRSFFFFFSILANVRQTFREHVWRWLKPFKCANCGEGFGREKTRAIHCEQRKTKCKTAVSTYEKSAEFRRDQQIETAKSTQEMIRIFDEYEKEVNG